MAYPNHQTAGDGSGRAQEHAGRSAVAADELDRQADHLVRTCLHRREVEPLDHPGARAEQRPMDLPALASGAADL